MFYRTINSGKVTDLKGKRFVSVKFLKLLFREKKMNLETTHGFYGNAEKNLGNCIRHSKYFSQGLLENFSFEKITDNFVPEESSLQKRSVLF